mmetsp:Transcript_26952/g.67914  ORF Transcript_26952/g.67914 Transcript_26952/m.67914 type:complete len:281 (+) Transcript_26952:180-1022(+)
MFSGSERHSPQSTSSHPCPLVRDRFAALAAATLVSTSASPTSSFSFHSSPADTAALTALRRAQQSKVLMKADDISVATRRGTGEPSLWPRTSGATCSHGIRLKSHHVETTDLYVLPNAHVKTGPSKAASNAPRTAAKTAQPRDPMDAAQAAKSSTLEFFSKLMGFRLPPCCNRFISVSSTSPFPADECRGSFFKALHRQGVCSDRVHACEPKKAMDTKPNPSGTADAEWLLHNGERSMLSARGCNSAANTTLQAQKATKKPAPHSQRVATFLSKCIASAT